MKKIIFLALLIIVQSTVFSQQFFRLDKPSGEIYYTSIIQIGNNNRFPTYQTWLGIVNNEFYFLLESRIQKPSLIQEIWIGDVIDHINKSATLQIGDGYFCASVSYYLFIYIIQVNPTIRYNYIIGKFAKTKY